MIPLLSHHGLQDLVAVGEMGTKSASDLLRDASVIAAALPPPRDDSHVCLISTRDRYAFAAGLLGIWLRGHAVALPPNSQRDTVSQIMEREDVSEILHDTPAGIGIHIPRLLATQSIDASSLPKLQVPKRDHIATLFTSGSVGEMKPFQKGEAQLFGEVEALAYLFAIPQGSCVVSTVGPTHLYGFLFGVLLPLSSGATFLRETPLLPEAIASKVRANSAHTLVSVPAHIRTFPTLEPESFNPLAMIISSTAPLHSETAKAVSTQHNMPIHEIFGSTETGGIASRVQVESPGYRPLPGVKIGVDSKGQLSVDSPFLDGDLERPFFTADRVSLEEDGSFIHLGRGDDIVKVGGHRVSLLGIEAVLLHHEGVLDATAIAVPDPTGRNRRILIAAVTQGVSSDALLGYLERRFPRTTLPRRIHRVASLPREANGKLRAARLLSMFGLGKDGKAQTTSLEFSELSSDSGHSCTRKYRTFIPEDYRYFDGHFPTYPILAGAVQLHELVLPCARRARPDFGELTAIEGLKFLNRIGPAEEVDIELTWEHKSEWLGFSLLRNTKHCTSGKLRFCLESD